ncbi:unannotated protein [freshwater metagenome]|uniref:Unannotated protein n=1 Tax=freshwater metagenome TaxID=449393 RepID=A0A6J7RG71_9ZZZZ
MLLHSWKNPFPLWSGVRRQLLGQGSSPSTSSLPMHLTTSHQAMCLHVRTSCTPAEPLACQKVWNFRPPCLLAVKISTSTLLRCSKTVSHCWAHTLLWARCITRVRSRVCACLLRVHPLSFWKSSTQSVFCNSLKPTKLPAALWCQRTSSVCSIFLSTYVKNTTYRV